MPSQIPFGMGGGNKEATVIKLICILKNAGLNGTDGRFPICSSVMIFKKTNYVEMYFILEG